MSDTVMPIEILREIRDAVDRMSAKLAERIDNVEKGLGARIDNVEKGLGARIDQTNLRLDSLDRRVTEGFIATNAKLADLSGRVGHLGEEVGELGGRVDRLGDRLENVLTGQFGQDVRDLKARMLLVEERLGPRAHEAETPYKPKT